jgi:hypothetical protein
MIHETELGACLGKRKVPKVEVHLCALNRHFSIDLLDI